MLQTVMTMLPLLLLSTQPAAAQTQQPQQEQVGWAIIVVDLII